MRDRSKSSDVSGEYSQGTTAHNRASALQRTQSVGQTAFAMAPVAALAAASSAALAPGPSARQHSMHSTIQDGTAFPAQHSMSRHATVSSAALAAAPSAPIASAAACDDAHVSATAAAFSAQQTDSTAAADLLIQAAAAASRAAASPEAEPDALAGTHNGAPGGAKGAMGVAGDPCDTSRAHPQADAAAAASQGQMADAGQGIKRTKRKVPFTTTSSRFSVTGTRASQLDG